MAGIGITLYELWLRVEGSNLPPYQCVNVKRRLDELHEKTTFRGNANVNIYSNMIQLTFILAELLYNAKKVGRKRDIVPEFTVTTEEYDHTSLPQRVRESLDSYTLPEAIKDHSQARYVGVTIEDNCGGFEGPVESHMGVSQTGSTGKGLVQLMKALPDIHAGLEIENKPGIGASFHFYFFKAE